MRTHFIRKILSSILFVVILTLLFQLYSKINNENLSHGILLIFGLLAFLILFLFIIIFSKNIIIKEVYETETDDLIQEIFEDDEDKHFLRKESLAVFSRHKSFKKLDSFLEYILTEFAHKFVAVQGIIYVRDGNSKKFTSTTNYALYGKKDDFEEGEGINGQVAEDKKIKVITEIPEGYITVVSGLGSAYPKNLLVVPFVNNNQTVAVLELASFEEFPKHIDEFYKHINNTIAKKINDLTTKNE